MRKPPLLLLPSLLPPSEELNSLMIMKTFIEFWKLLNSRIRILNGKLTLTHNPYP